MSWRRSRNPVRLKIGWASSRLSEAQLAACCIPGTAVDPAAAKTFAGGFAHAASAVRATSPTRDELPALGQISRRYTTAAPEVPQLYQRPRDIKSAGGKLRANSIAAYATHRPSWLPSLRDCERTLERVARPPHIRSALTPGKPVRVATRTNRNILPLWQYERGPTFSSLLADQPLVFALHHGQIKPPSRHHLFHFGEIRRLPCAALI